MTLAETVFVDLRNAIHINAREEDEAKLKREKEAIRRRYE